MQKKPNLNQSFSKPIVLIPAWNEQNNISQTISELKKTGLNFKILLVNDGSTDKTIETAEKQFRESGFSKEDYEIISHPKNMGKTAAFFTGLKRALQLNPVALITIDADMEKVPRTSLEEMLNPVIQATKERKVKMVVAKVKEGHLNMDVDYSGIRAFSSGALSLLRQSNVKRFPQGYGLELFLQQLFKTHSPTSYLVQNHPEILQKNQRLFLEEERVLTERGKRQEKELMKIVNQRNKIQRRLRPRK